MRWYETMTNFNSIATAPAVRALSHWFLAVDVLTKYLILSGSAIKAVAFYI